MDKILLKGIRFFGYHGVSPAERETGGMFEVDVELYLPLAPPGISDAVEETIDYTEAFEIVQETGQSEQFHLLEALAEEISKRLLTAFPNRLEKVRVTVKKLRPPLPGILQYSAVEIERFPSSQGTTSEE